MAEDQEFVLPPLEERPLVTFALFAYNQEKYIREAVEGAFAQTYEPLEIILSDDGSGDATFAIMQELVTAYIGPHRVRLNRNPENIGLASHVNRVLAMAQGEIIVMAAGDDISLPHRVADTVATFANYPEAMALSFSDVRIDENGAQVSAQRPSNAERLIDLRTFLAAGPQAQSKLNISAASRAFRRCVYDKFEDLTPACPAEDSPYLLRILYLGPLIVCDRPAILYRIHGLQISSERRISEMNPALFVNQYRKDLTKAIESDLLSPALQRAARTYFSERKTAFIFRELLYKGLTPGLHILLRVLLSPYYPLRVKAGLFKRFILRGGSN